MRSEAKKIVIEIWEENGEIEFTVEAPQVEDMTREDATEGMAAALFMVALRLDPALSEVIKDDVDE